MREPESRQRRGNTEPLGFQQVPSSRAFESIVQQIKDRIIDGRLSVGSRLPPEREMAVMFGVSRASLREALRVLETLGVLSSGKRGVGPDSGYSIAPSEGDHFGSLLELHAALLGIPLADLLEARESVESVAISRACEHATESDCVELQSIITRMDSDLEPEVFLERDTEFHVAIARSSGNVVLPLLMEALRGAISRQMLATFRELDDWPRERTGLIKQHRQILDIVVAKDVTKAASAIHDHLHGFYERTT